MDSEDFFLAFPSIQFLPAEAALVSHLHFYIVVVVLAPDKLGSSFLLRVNFDFAGSLRNFSFLGLFGLKGLFLFDLSRNSHLRTWSFR